MPLDEGYIKFNLQWKQAPPLPDDELKEIIKYRNICFQKKYIGIADGIGYGNISVRYQNGDQFVISGTQTGGLEKLTAEHFTLVTEVDFERNSVACRGPVKASAESLTHAMIYRLNDDIQAVIHIHNRRMWDALKFKVPTTGESIPYGTIKMCREVEKLYQTSDLKTKKIIAMAGHEEGIISFGSTLQEALNILDQYTSVAES